MRTQTFNVTCKAGASPFEAVRNFLEARGIRLFASLHMQLTGATGTEDPMDMGYAVMVTWNEEASR